MFLFIVSHLISQDGKGVKVVKLFKTVGMTFRNNPS